MIFCAHKLAGFFKTILFIYLLMERAIVKRQLYNGFMQMEKQEISNTLPFKSLGQVKFL